MGKSWEGNNYIYQVGGSLGIDASCYVERAADRILYEALQSGQFCYVFNSRQMGKSSLRVRTMHQLQKSGIICIALDLTRVGSEHLTPAQWYIRIISELWRGANLTDRLNLKDWLQEHSELTHVQLLDAFLEEVLLQKITIAKIVIFIDEIDSLINLDFAINDFFALIRACYNQRVDNPDYNRLTFCLLGVATPTDLIRDKTRTPFNIGKAIALSGFNLTEARVLSQGLKVKFSAPLLVLKEILFWTGGQPLLTQKLCHLAVETVEFNSQLSLTKDDREIKTWIKDLVTTRIIANWQYQDEPEHLRTIRDRLLRKEKQASQLLSIYQKILTDGAVEANDSQGQIELRLSGLVVRDRSQLKVYNPIYQAVFDRTWVEETLNNLRPYAETFNAWIASKSQDSSLLLQGDSLKEALQWSADKNLSREEEIYLRTSQEYENQKTKQANQILEESVQKARRNINRGKVILFSTILLASVVGWWSQRAIRSAYRARLGLSFERESIELQQKFDLSRDNSIEDLVKAMENAYQIKKLKERRPNAKYPTTLPILTLQHILDHIQKQPLSGANNSLNTKIDLRFPQNPLITSKNGQIIFRDLDGKSQVTIPRSHKGISDTRGLSPDGKLIVMGGADCKTRIYDLKGNSINIFKHQGSVRNALFHPNGRNIITREYIPKKEEFLTDEEKFSCSVFPNERYFTDYSRWKTVIRVWDLEGNLLKAFEIPQAISDFQLSSDGNYFLHFGNKTTSRTQDSVAIPQLWSIRGERLVTFRDLQNYGTISFHPKGKCFVTTTKTGGNSILDIWSLDGQKLATLKNNWQGVLWSRDLASGSYYLISWNYQYNQMSSGIEAVKFSSYDDRMAIFQKNSDVKLLNCQGKQLASLSQKKGKIIKLNFSSNGDRLLRQINETDYQIEDFQGETIASFSVAPSFDVNSAENIAFAFDNPDSLLVFRQTEKNNQMAYSQYNYDNKAALTIPYDGLLTNIWKMTGKQTPKTLENVRWGNSPSRVIGFPYDIHFSEEKQSLFLSINNDDESFYRYNFRPDNSLATTDFATLGINEEYLTKIENTLFEPLADSLDNIQLSPDGRYIAWVQEGKLRLWDTEQKKITNFPGVRDRIVNGFQFIPNSNKILISEVKTTDNWGFTFDDALLKIWNVNSDRIVILPGGWANWQTRYPFSNIISPDGRYIAAYQFDKTDRFNGKEKIAVWDSQGNKIGVIDISHFNTPSKNKDDKSRFNFYKFNNRGDKLAIVVDDRDKNSKLKSQHLFLWDIHGKSSQKSIKLKFSTSEVEEHTNQIYNVYFARSDRKLFVNYSIHRNTNVFFNGERQFKEEILTQEINLNFLKPGTYLRNILFSTFKVSRGSFYKKYFINFDSDSIKISAINPFSRTEIVAPVHEFKEVRVSPDGNRIATLETNNKIKIWTIQGEQIAKFEGSLMRFNSDWSQILVAVPEDKTLKVWQLNDLDELLARGCNWLQFYLEDSKTNLARYCRNIN